MAIQPIISQWLKSPKKTTTLIADNILCNNLSSISDVFGGILHEFNYQIFIVDLSVYWILIIQLWLIAQMWLKQPRN